MWNNEDDYDTQILAASYQHGVPLAALKATAGVESSFTPSALNQGDPGGAWGMFQMIPLTARGLGYNGAMENLQTDVSLAADLAAKLWAQNMAYSGGDILGAASAYNGGWRPAMGFGRRVNGKFANQSYVDRFERAYRYFNEKGGAVTSTASFRNESPPLVDTVGVGRSEGRERTLGLIAAIVVIGAFLLANYFLGGMK